MKPYKFNFKNLVLLLILCSVSCTDEFISKPIQPGTQSDATFRKTADGLLFTLNASYAPLAGNYWYMYALNRLSLGNYRSDDAQKGAESKESDVSEQSINDFNIFPTNSIVKEFWRTCYIGVHYANAVIESAPEALTVALPVDVPKINNYVGEAKVLRAYWYFELVKAFGDLPMLLSATDQTIIGRTNRLLIYDQIQKDLIEASTVLQPANQLAETDKGRMSSGAALALLAKVYLFRASVEPEKAGEYYTLSHQAAKNVIDSNQFSLLPSYSSNWKPEGDFSSEGIIEGGQPDDKGDIGYYGVATAPRYYYTGKKTATGLNIKGPASAYGWGFNTPTQDLVETFESGDPRKNWTIYEQGDSANVGISNKSTMLLICFDSSPTGYYTRKYVPNGYPVQGINHLNVKYFRYSDLILVGAEAANEIGNSADALAWLELVRKRARNTLAAPHHSINKIEGAPVVVTESNKDLLRAIIHRERRVELAMEDGRFNDLVRWDGKNGFDFATTIQMAQAKIGPNFQIDNDEKSGTPRIGHSVIVEQKHKLLPIPEADIKTSGNILTQNEGY